jgi:drug/metabolite transporter (DMT)-like permease
MYFNWITPNFHQAVMLLCIGVAGALYQFLMILALKYISSKLESSMMFSSVVFAGLLGWLVYNITPTMTTVMGIVITVTGAVLIIFYSSKEGKKRIAKYS